ncbi:flavin-dependent dehydrogenase [Xanthomonas arboricola]|nr:flavin-dependent dehydrogenase [Xanthomonas sp. 3058]
MLDGMNSTDDFYFAALRQVRVQRWHKGRVALTGDAAWCATPLAGIGTTLAVTGGYVLANEIACNDTLGSAFATYAAAMQSMVDGRTRPGRSENRAATDEPTWPAWHSAAAGRVDIHQSAERTEFRRNADDAVDRGTKSVGRRPKPTTAQSPVPSLRMAKRDDGNALRQRALPRWGAPALLIPRLPADTLTHLQTPPRLAG